MRLVELFGVRKLRCAICGHPHMFYVGRFSDQFEEMFTAEERTCENCRKYTWSQRDIADIETNWTTSEIIEAISGELENQNMHRRLSDPELLCSVLRDNDVGELTLQKVLIEFYQSILNTGGLNNEAK